MLIVSRQYRLIWTCWNFEVAFWSPRFHHPFGADCSCSSALGSLQKILTTSWELNLGIEVFYLAPHDEAQLSGFYFDVVDQNRSYHLSLKSSLFWIFLDHLNLHLMFAPKWLHSSFFFFPLHPHTSSFEGIKHHEWIKQLVSSLCEVRDHVVQGCRPGST